MTGSRAVQPDYRMSNSNQPPEDPRTRLAGERTLLAWVRTGLAMMGFGFVVARFGLFLRELEIARTSTEHHSTGLSLWIGIVLVLGGVATTGLAAMQHKRFLGRLDRGETYVAPRWSLGIIVAVGLAAIGLWMALYLLGVGR
jgi:putative membrane protein